MQKIHKKLNFLSLIIFLLFTCHSPLKPIGEINIINSISIDTQGNCLDLDIDISENILVAAANYNGYFIYTMNDDYEIIDTIHIDPEVPAQMDDAIGDNRAQSVVISKKMIIFGFIDMI